MNKKKFEEMLKETSIRQDGRVEWLCEHGIGHTIYVPKKHTKDISWWVHGCDGCCEQDYVKEFKKDYKKKVKHLR